MNKHRLIFISLILSSFLINYNFAQEQFIKSGENWKYFDNGSLPNDWFQKSEFDANWKSGVTPIGYGDRKVQTNIKFGSDSENKDPIKYFSKIITIDKAERFLAFGFQIKRDDGIVIYVNGNEVYRNNIPLVSVTGSTFAVERIDGSQESEIIFATIDPEFIKNGENKIAVSVHQVSPSSSDCIFDLEMFGYTDPKMLSKIISNQSAANTQLENQIKSLNTNLLLEKTALQLEIEKSRAENYLIVLIILSILWVILIFIFLFTYLNFRKKETTHKDKLKEVNDHQKIKDQELMMLNTKLLHNKQYFKELKADLRGLKNVNDSTVNDMIYHVNQALQSEKEWESFHQHFDSVFEGFHDKLLESHPSLTEVELRHCMFIKLHLQTKEIAKILLIDPRSVQTSRYRIKKKMELSEDMDLRSYLLSII